MPNTCKSNELSSSRKREGSEWRTGEEHVGDLPFSEEYRREIADKTAYASLLREGEGKFRKGRWKKGLWPISWLVG